MQLPYVEDFRVLKNMIVPHWLTLGNRGNAHTAGLSMNIFSLHSFMLLTKAGPEINSFVPFWTAGFCSVIPYDVQYFRIQSVLHLFIKVSHRSL